MRSKPVGARRLKRAVETMEQANRLALMEHLEPHQVADRLGLSYANLRNLAAAAGFRYRRAPGLWVPTHDVSESSEATQ